MQKTDQMELKKTIKKDNTTITKIVGCYVDCDKNKKCIVDNRFLTLPEEEMYKYMEILKKLMSCKAGDTLQTLSVDESSDSIKLLRGIISDELKNDSLYNAFFDNVIESFHYDNGYLILLYHSVYDVPAKGSDKLKQDESDEVYSAIYCAICPMEMSKACLSYHEIENTIANRNRDCIVQDPYIGFMYPDFDNREENRSSAAYAVCNKKEAHEEFAEKVLGCTSKKTSKGKNQAFKEALDNALTNAPIEVIKKVNEHFIKEIEDNIEEYEASQVEESEDDEKPIASVKHKKIETHVEPEKVKEILVKSGVEKEKAENFVSAYKNSVSSPEDIEETIVLESVVPKKTTIKSSDISINMDASKLNHIKKQIIDGREYLLIPIEDSIKINGIDAKF